LGFIELEGEVRPPAIVIIKGDVATALVVDEIGDIAEVASEDIEPPVSIIDRAQAEFISGSVHVGEAMVGLINTERMLEPVVTGGRS
jgi:chemotaxis signal transduction protein